MKHIKTVVPASINSDNTICHAGMFAESILDGIENGALNGISDAATAAGLSGAIDVI